MIWDEYYALKVGDVVDVSAWVSAWDIDCGPTAVVTRSPGGDGRPAAIQILGFPYTHPGDCHSVEQFHLQVFVMPDTKDPRALAEWLMS